jgi:hypothetical protein
MKGEYTTTKIKRETHQKVKEYCVKTMMGLPYFYEMAAKSLLRIIENQNSAKKKKAK